MANPVDTIPTKGERDSATWINWYRLLKKQFGTTEANNLFVKAWRSRGSSSANTHELREELKKGGLVIDTSVWDSLVDTGHGIGDEISSLFQMGKIATYALLGITVLGIGLIVYNIARNPNATIAAAKPL